MCYTIKSENVLANYFATHEDSKITMQTLKELRNAIEEALNFEVYVDITLDSLIDATELFPKRFSWDEEEDIVCEKDAKTRLMNFDYLESRYNWKLPADVKTTYCRLIAAQ